MAIIAVLGTGVGKEEVCEIMHLLGFGNCQGQDPTSKGMFDHSSVENLRVQMHNPSYLRGVEGIVTEMEFETRGAPQTAEMFDVLRNLYERMPDIVYCQAYAIIQKKTPVCPLSHFFES